MILQVENNMTSEDVIDGKVVGFIKKGTLRIGKIQNNTKINMFCVVDIITNKEHYVGYLELIEIGKGGTKCNIVQGVVNYEKIN